MMPKPDTSEEPMSYTYASWGGTGRASCLRQAIEIAFSDRAELTYLAILDDDAFSDLDDYLRAVVADELRWLLETQIDLAKRQTGKDLRVRLSVVSGQIDDAIATAAHSSDRILVGSPFSIDAAPFVAQLVQKVHNDTGVPIEIIEPD